MNASTTRADRDADAGLPEDRVDRPIGGLGRHGCPNPSRRAEEDNSGACQGTNPAEPQVKGNMSTSKSKKTPAMAANTERTEKMKPKKQNRAISKKLMAVASEIAQCCSTLLDELRTDLEFDDNPELYVAMQLYDTLNIAYHMKRYVDGDTRMSPLRGIDAFRQLSKRLRKHFVEPNGRVQAESLEALDMAIADMVALVPKSRA